MVQNSKGRREKPSEFHHTVQGHKSVSSEDWRSCGHWQFQSLLRGLNFVGSVGQTRHQI